MRLPEAIRKIKADPELSREVFLVLLFLFSMMGAFLIGIMYERESHAKNDEVRIILPEPTEIGATVGNAVSDDGSTRAIRGVATGNYVGSMSGTTYHLPWCSGAKRIKDENKVWFATKEEAESKGYRPAGNCKGI